jgi:hypothetical protein
LYEKHARIMLMKLTPGVKIEKWRGHLNTIAIHFWVKFEQHFWDGRVFCKSWFDVLLQSRFGTSIHSVRT